MNNWEGWIKPAQQDWVIRLPIMQQSVLFAAVRAPDGIRKNHPVKVLLRWYRRCVLLSAFEGEPICDPFSPGGGSFTGPFELAHAAEAGLLPLGDIEKLGGWEKLKSHFFRLMRNIYLDHVDELPHHFQLHFMHAAEIVGYHHPIDWISSYWNEFYVMIVDDAHLHPETADEMNLRLSDNPDRWREREVRTEK